MPYGYRAPTHHMRFVMERVLHAPQSWRACPGLSELDIHTAEAVLDEAAHFASGCCCRSMRGATSRAVC